MTSRSIFAAGAAMVAAVLLAGPLRADDGLQIPPVTDAVVKKECGACHMVYPPGLLPARSWSAMMKGLGDHFGDNAELDAALAKQIEDYLVANAADKNRSTSRMLRNVSAGAAPQRISELPWFVREHENEILSPAALAKKKAKFKGDCKACHERAEQGFFEEDEEHEGRRNLGRERHR
jgi:cytochrome c5